MKKFTIIFLVLILLLFVSCKVEESDERSTIKFYNCNSNDIERTNKTLLFTDNDIDSFDWESQTIYFNENIYIQDELLEGRKAVGIGSEIFSTGSRDLFLVYVDDELIYEGQYSQSYASSYMPIGVVLLDQLDGVRLSYSMLDGNEDIRFDERIYKALNSNNLLKE